MRWLHAPDAAVFASAAVNRHSRRRDMQSRAQAGGVLGYLSLFTSLGTLLCCALPALLVLVGLGATVASVVSSAPWLITLSRHKNWTFAIAGLLITANFFYVFLVASR